MFPWKIETFTGKNMKYKKYPSVLFKTPTSEKVKSFSIPKIPFVLFWFPTLSQAPNTAYNSYTPHSNSLLSYPLPIFMRKIYHKNKKWNFLGKQAEKYIYIYIDIYLVEDQTTWFVNDVEAVNSCHFKGQFRNLINFWDRSKMS